MTQTDVTVRRMPGSLDEFRDRPNAPKPPAAPPVRVRWLVVLLILLGAGFFGGIGSWAALAPLRSAVVAQGAIKVQGDRLVVQHLEGGIVETIHIREGSFVDAGAVIVELDDTRAMATMGVLHNQLAGALATEARLEAEFDEAETFEIGPELQALITQYPELAETVSHERDLFDANHSMTVGQTEILTDRIAQLNESVQGFEKRRKAFADQLLLVEEELEGLEVLFEKGLLPKPRVLSRRRDQTALMGEVAVAEAEMQTIAKQIIEIRERILQVRRDRMMEISDARRLVKERIFDLRQRIAANEDITRRLSIRAPQSGRVVGLQVNTIGEVIGPGEPLMEIVPEDSTIVVEARVRPDDIDQVARDSEARVRLTAFNFRTTPPLPARVTEISADAFFDATDGSSFYEVELLLDADAIAGLDVSVPTLPGMQAQVMIATGEQTLANYLLGPVVGGLETALLESD